jgi:hypothetical protein
MLNAHVLISEIITCGRACSLTRARPIALPVRLPAKPRPPADQGGELMKTLVVAVVAAGRQCAGSGGAGGHPVNDPGWCAKTGRFGGSFSLRTGNTSAARIRPTNLPKDLPRRPPHPTSGSGPRAASTQRQKHVRLPECL